MIPSFLPSITVVVEERAKFAPIFAPKPTLLVAPFVAAIELVTALPKVLATAVPTVLLVLSLKVFAVPLAIVSTAVFPRALAVLLFQPWLKLASTLDSIPNFIPVEPPPPIELDCPVVAVLVSLVPSELL